MSLSGRSSRGMDTPLLTIQLRYEHDIVLARQRARQIAGLVGFDSQEQTRIATAVSELARNAFEYAGTGKLEFGVDAGAPQALRITVSDRGPGITRLQEILEGHYVSETGMGLGILGAKRLMDRFELQNGPEGGTVVQLGQFLPKNTPLLTPQRLTEIATALSRRAPESPFEEMQQQNQELLRALEELHSRETDVDRLNLELEETNRGVMALYAELDDKAEQLRAASETKSRFLSNMSHEFRTPLSAIVSLSGLLLSRMDGELTEEQDKQIQFIRHSAHELIEIVNDLLDIAKIEAGRLIVTPAWFEMASLFGALRGMFRPLLLSKQVALFFDEAGDLPSMYSDEGKVAQILRNFISNAIKFTPEGEIHIAARMDEKGLVHFSVRDTGIGIPVDMHDKIFQEFTQVDSVVQKTVKGTGLGLPLCRRLADLLGGSVSVESAPGVGSTFTVSLPQRFKETADAEGAESSRAEITHE